MVEVVAFFYNRTYKKKIFKKKLGAAKKKTKLKNRHGFGLPVGEHERLHGLPPNLRERSWIAVDATRGRSGKVARVDASSRDRGHGSAGVREAGNGDVGPGVREAGSGDDGEAGKGDDGVGAAGKGDDGEAGIGDVVRDGIPSRDGNGCAPRT